MLVAAFSTVVAFGALTGLSGVKGDAHGVSGTEAANVVVVGDEAQAFPADTVWD
ncbi:MULTISPECIES: hypothetical protein [Streptomyces]|uniref:hypothetical protein n=1 Tax=Streptomyces TaxID=1883 RepID=UPI001428C007|nr:hypothetical protein [Streptomyces canus]